MDEAATEPPPLARHDADAHDRISARERTSKRRCSSRTASIPPGYLRRAVLFSDGVETDGDILAEANRAEKLGVKLFTVPYRGAVPGEVAVRACACPIA